MVIAKADMEVDGRLALPGRPRIEDAVRAREDLRFMAVLVPHPIRRLARAPQHLKNLCAMLRRTHRSSGEPQYIALVHLHGPLPSRSAHSCAVVEDLSFSSVRLYEPSDPSDRSAYVVLRRALRHDQGLPTDPRRSA